MTKRRSCEGKIQYETRELAAEAIQRLIKRGSAPNASEVYWCKHCKWWHHGHISPRLRRPR
jgi:hypothetical protein